MKATPSDAVVREDGLHLHKVGDFPPLRGGIKGTVHPAAKSATSMLFIRRFSPPWLPSPLGREARVGAASDRTKTESPARGGAFRYQSFEKDQKERCTRSVAFQT